MNKKREGGIMLRKALYLSLVIVLGFAGSYLLPDGGNEKQALTGNDYSGQIAMLQAELQNTPRGTAEWAVLQNHIQKLEKLRAGKIKTNRPDMFAKFYHDIRTREGEENPGYGLNYRLRALDKALQEKQENPRALLKSVSSEMTFVERGPSNVPGRTRGLLVDAGDPSNNTWLAGTVGGGIWKTTDGGQTWQAKTEDLPLLAISYFAQPASNPDIIYAGTGEGFFNTDQINGNGILKSTDGGESWKLLPSTTENPQFVNINRVIVDPDDADVVLACSNGGIYTSDYRSVIMKSVDGGMSWEQKYAHGTNARIQHLIANPLNFNTQFASVNGVGIIKSVNAGETWNLVSGSLSDLGGRLELAMTEQDTNLVYAAAEGGSSNSVLYVSFDAGNTWAKAKDSGNDPNWLNGQGWYDNTIMVDPQNKFKLYVGGVQVYTINLTDTALVVTRETKVYDIVRNNTTEFLNTINFSNKNFNGFYYSDGKDENAPNLADSDFVSVELRFGPGKGQKAHRFTVPEGSTSGVPTDQYAYTDYVDIPFEAWDITNNRQLMVSFRDQDRDSVFNYSNDLETRQYVFISGYTYDAQNPNENIARNGGHLDKLLYFYWPVSPGSTPFNNDNLPASEANLQILYGEVVNSSVTRLAESFSQAHGAHVDHHNLKAFKNADGSYGLINANDGGVAYATTLDARWVRSYGINSTQYYGADKKPGANVYLAGAQDNGTWYSNENPDSSSEWNYGQFSVNADGFNVVWHFNDPQKLIGSWQFGNLERSVDGGKNWSVSRSGSSNTDPFITKITGSQIKPDLLFAVSSRGVYKSTDFGKTWQTKVIDNEAWTAGGSFSNVKVSKANSNIVWAGDRMSSSGRIFVSVDEGETFQPVNNYAGITLGRISGMATDPVSDSTAYVLFSFDSAPKILKTTDLGQTWIDISGYSNGVSTAGFPNVAVYDLLVMPFDTNMMWAGTEIGLFETTDGGASWHFADYGLPAASIWQLKEVEDQIVVATHGRGVWSITIPELTLDKPYAPLITDIKQDANGDLSFSLKMRFASDSTVIMAGTEKLAVMGAVSATTDTLFTVPVPETLSGNRKIRLLSYKDGKVRENSKKVNISSTASPEIALGLLAAEVVKSNLRSYLVSDIKLGVSPEIKYELTRGSGGTEVSNDLMSYISSSSFVYAAPYKLKEAGDLRVTVKAKNKFGATSELMRDYSISSLTKSGAQSISLPGGHDALPVSPSIVADAGFVVASFTEEPGIYGLPSKDNGDDMMRLGQILSLDGTARLNAGLVIPLFYDDEDMERIADEYNEFEEAKIGLYQYVDENWRYVGGRGRNGRVEAPVPGYGQYAVFYNPKARAVPAGFTLAQNFPNPFNPTTTIRYEVPSASRVTLTVYNMLGRKIATLVSGDQEAGFYSVRWEGVNDRGVQVASGLYLYTLQAGHVRVSKKMLLVR
ncbi:MAG TPA: T9SS type A sorting domain-containing protein [Caldithrix abyssi]|uniref:T9SS type A sorting domain-containing protein n=1 Tax=Caldithrix abyssi TaxID=187145 RepID=A0A7V5RQV1_CALAY|nr:T9SS type A sorting domain-containing protein [Caldithrix abyssi]